MFSLWLGQRAILIVMNGGKPSGVGFEHSGRREMDVNRLELLPLGRNPGFRVQMMRTAFVTLLAIGLTAYRVIRR